MLYSSEKKYKNNNRKEADCNTKLNQMTPHKLQYKIQSSLLEWEASIFHYPESKEVNYFQDSQGSKLKSDSSIRSCINCTHVVEPIKQSSIMLLLENGCKPVNA